MQTAEVKVFRYFIGSDFEPYAADIEAAITTAIGQARPDIVIKKITAGVQIKPEDLRDPGINMILMTPAVTKECEDQFSLVSNAKRFYKNQITFPFWVDNLHSGRFDQYSQMIFELSGVGGYPAGGHNKLSIFDGQQIMDNVAEDFQKYLLKFLS